MSSRGCLLSKTMMLCIAFDLSSVVDDSRILFADICRGEYSAVSTPSSFTSRRCYFRSRARLSLARDGRPRSRRSQQRARGPPGRSSDNRSDAAPARRRQRPRRRRSTPIASTASVACCCGPHASGTAVPSLTRLPVMKTVLIGTPATLRTAAFCMPSAAAQIAALHWPAMNSEPPSISAVSTSGSAGGSFSLQRDFGDDDRRQERSQLFRDESRRGRDSALARSMPSRTVLPVIAPTKVS